MVAKTALFCRSTLVLDVKCPIIQEKRCPFPAGNVLCALTAKVTVFYKPSPTWSSSSYAAAHPRSFLTAAFWGVMFSRVNVCTIYLVSVVTIQPSLTCVCNKKSNTIEKISQLGLTLFIDLGGDHEVFGITRNTAVICLLNGK